jgi:tetratricopeptide (TPR) repeat protein
MRCLDDELVQVEALRELRDADGSTSAAVDAAVARLSRADACTTPQTLAWDDSALEARKRLAELYALVLADHRAEAEAMIRELRPQFEALENRAFIGRLEFEAGSLLLEDEDYRGAIERLTPALRDAEASGDHLAAVRAAGKLMAAYERLGDSAASDRHRRIAEATMRRVGSHDEMQRDFAGELALVFMYRGDFDAAIEQQRLVVEGAVDPANKVGQELNLATLLSRAERHEEAIAQARAAMRHHAELPSVDHVATIAHTVNLGMVEALGGESDAAARTFSTAYGQARELLGDEHPYTSMALYNLGTHELVHGDPARAVPQLLAALAQRRARFAAGDQMRRQMLGTLVDALVEAGALDDAIAAQRELVDEIEASPRPTSDALVGALVDLAELELQRGTDVEPVLRRMKPWLDGADLPDELTTRIASLHRS